MQYHKQIIILSLFFSYVVQTAPLVIVEGNIGVGKSTFLKILQTKFKQANILLEPVAKWQNVNGHNVLDAFYKDMNRWTYSFESYALISHIQEYEKICESNQALCFMERSWFSHKFCFAKNSLLLGTLNDMEWSLYSDVWDWCMTKVEKPLGIVYLRAEPELCQKRIKDRNRSEESSVSLEYLTMLHQRYEEWLIEKQNHETVDIPVLILDASLDFKNDKEICDAFLLQVFNFLNKNKSVDFTN